MKVPFKNLPGHSRIWIYQADRNLTADEEQELHIKLDEFLATWNAHKNELTCSGEIFHHRFLVLAVDEGVHGVSGCSIDSSVHFIKSIESKFQVNFFNRSLVPFLVNGQVTSIPLSELKAKVSEGIISPETKTFNNLIDKKLVFEENWLVPAGETWLNRYFA